MLNIVRAVAFSLVVQAALAQSAVAQSSNLKCGYLLRYDLTWPAGYSGNDKPYTTKNHAGMHSTMEQCESVRTKRSFKHEPAKVKHWCESTCEIQFFPSPAASAPKARPSPSRSN